MIYPPKELVVRTTQLEEPDSVYGTAYATPLLPRWVLIGQQCV